jgi:hypothetical protein
VVGVGKLYLQAAWQLLLLPAHQIERALAASSTL